MSLADYRGQVVLLVFWGSDELDRKIEKLVEAAGEANPTKAAEKP